MKRYHIFARTERGLTFIVYVDHFSEVLAIEEFHKYNANCHIIEIRDR